MDMGGALAQPQARGANRALTLRPPPRPLPGEPSARRDLPTTHKLDKPLSKQPPGHHVRSDGRHPEVVLLSRCHDSHRGRPRLAASQQREAVAPMRAGGINEGPSNEPVENVKLGAVVEQKLHLRAFASTIAESAAPDPLGTIGLGFDEDGATGTIREIEDGNVEAESRNNSSRLLVAAGANEVEQGRLELRFRVDDRGFDLSGH